MAELVADISETEQRLANAKSTHLVPDPDPTGLPPPPLPPQNYSLSTLPDNDSSTPSQAALPPTPPTQPPAPPQASKPLLPVMGLYLTLTKLLVAVLDADWSTTLPSSAEISEIAQLNSCIIVSPFINTNFLDT